MNKLDIDDFPPVVRQHLQGLELSEEQKAVWNFHAWMRDQHSDLSPGYRNDLVVAAYALLVRGMDPEEVPNSSAVMSKLEEFVESSEVSEDE